MSKHPYSNKKESSAHLKIGQQAEKSAQIHLQQRGLIHIESNYACRYGEIDLVMQDQDSLVFVEVRLRKNTQYGGAAASISYAKQRRLIKSALFYSQQKKLDCPARFDVVVFDGNNPQPQWIKNAFDAY